MSAGVSPDQSKKQRIGINAHLLAGEQSYRRAGIHQYIYQVLRHLPQEDDLRYTVYTQQTEGWEERADFQLVSSSLPTKRRLARILWEQFAWPRAARRDGLALMHSMAFATPSKAPCPVVTTIYDLSFIHYPDSFPALQRRYLTSVTADSCRRSARLITISESGRDDVVERFGVPVEVVDVVLPGVADHFRPFPPEAVDAFRAQQGLSSPFILHVGTLQPRKNIPILLEALARLNRPDLLLVLAGGKGWFYEDILRRITTLGLQDQVRFAGYVADETLPLWYNAAVALVMPSLYEGFGLPVVEALACGTPVIAARTSSLPEAGGSVARYFDPRSPDELVSEIIRVLDDPVERRRARERGPAHAAHFSWAAAGEATAEVYAKVLHRTSPIPAREDRTG